MKRKDFPWFVLVLIIMCSFSFKTNTSTSSFNYAGMPVALGILIIVSIVLIFKIIEITQGVLLSYQLIKQKVKSKYDKLLLFVIILPAIGYTARGESIKGMLDKTVPSWIFKWGNSEVYIWVILSFLLFMLLHRIMLIMQEIKRTKELTNGSSGTANPPCDVDKNEINKG